MQKPGHARTAIRAARELLGDGVEIVRGGLNPRVTVNQLKDVEQIGAHIVQLSLNCFAGLNAVERALDEAERLLQSIMKESGSSFTPLLFDAPLK